ncbi:MAG: right-handed parallel beta-helix repeat-containing protein [Clostridia bacterium]|nr:right-handed parallel beta-helix repeat-containing protein [Clostridia bacterium]
MKYVVTKYGIVGDGKTSNSEALSKLINEAQDGSTIFFPAGVYYTDKCIHVNGKKKLTIEGEDATIMTHFGPCGDPKENNNMFAFNGCDDLVIRDFIFTTDNPIGWSGVVTAVNQEKMYYEVRIYSQFEVTGLEHPVALNSCDKDGTPDYMFNGGKWREATTVTVDGKEVTRYAGYDYEVIGDHLLRFFVADSHVNDLKRLKVGEQVCYRFIVYGNSHLNFSNCNRVLLKNIENYRCSSMGTVISPRCSDFTFDHYNIEVKPGSQELYAANADGIHILGLTGTLRFKHCKFNGLGDDVLNIHGTAGEITAINEDGSMKLEHRHRNGFSPLQKNWAIPGDVVQVYDAKTFAPKGTFTVGTYEDGVTTITASTGTIEVGDALANTVYYAATHISDCIIKNTRARALLLQTHNITVEDCYFFGLSLPGLLLSPDIRFWYEVGPTSHTLIQNNVFEKCAIIKARQNRGAISVLCAHDTDPNELNKAGVHEDIKILNNVFRGTGNSAIYISATDGVEVRGNLFENCCNNRYNPRAYDVRHDIVTFQCDHITIADNRTTQKEKNLFYAIRSKNITKQ